MTDLSKTLDRIKPSPTLQVTARAAELRAEGKDVIGLGAGEPDFDTPDHVKQAAIEAIHRGETKYTKVDGTPELKAAVREKFARDNALDYAPDEVSVNCGGKHTIFNAMMATLNPGDEVIIPAPYWVSYPDMALIAGGTPVIVKAGLENGYKLSPAMLASAITAKSKWLIFNSPSNPTGAAYSIAEIEALADVIRAHPNLMVLSDEIYEHITYDGFEFRSFAAVAPDLKARTLTVNGVAKAWAMTGWRIGFAGGPADLIKAMAKVQSQSTSNPSSISQAAAIAALSGPYDFMAERRDEFKARRDRVVGLLNAIDGLECRAGEGAFYLYPSCADVIGRRTPAGAVIETDLDYATYLLEEAGVAVVHGEAFGLSPCFRVSYATDMATLARACERISEATARLSTG
ncbi:MAG: pyridoxal phosphate-dependent aminotransferase [Pseudomonadota bacterium]